MPKQPPQIGGIMELTPEQTTDLQTKLTAIVASFVETDEQPVCDVFYITSTYNKANTDFPINGDTVQFLLTPVEEVPADGTNL